MNLVETTNDFSIVSKASIVERGYVDDPYVRYFVSKVKRRSPLINRGYYVRFKAINFGIQASRCDLIISLGCGFDTLAFRGEYKGKLIEIDFPGVVLNKAKVIVEHNLILPITFVNLSSKEVPRIVLQAPDYCLIAADLRDTKAVAQIFVEKLLTYTENVERVAILNECSLCYIEEKVVNLLLKQLLHLFSHLKVTFISYEMLISEASNDAFTKVMVSHFESIGSPLKTLLNKSQIVTRMKNIGFQRVIVYDMSTFWRSLISNEEKKRVNKLEPFDEFEEFDLLCSNYCLTIANCTNSESLSEIVSSEHNESMENDSFLKYEVSQNYFKRFAHCSSSTQAEEVFFFGGFGLSDEVEGKHQRLSDLIRFNPRTKSIAKCQINGSLESRMHSQLISLNSQVLLLIGGRSSPNNRFEGTFIRYLEELNFGVTNEKWSNLPSCFRHTATLLNDSSVLHFGGIGSAQDAVYVYDVFQNSWKIKKCEFANRHSHSCCSLNENVVAVTGGLNIDDNDFTGDNFLYDMRSNSCNILKNLPLLYSHTSHCNSHSLLICGGISPTGSHNEILIYDLRNQLVTASFNIDKKYRLMLHNHCSVYLDSKLYSIGGGGNCFSFGTHINEFSIEFNSSFTLNSS